jgi:hypothetical protein
MEWFDELRRAQLEELEPVNPQMAAWLRELGALYLYGTIGSEAVLLPDGRMRIWNADRWPESGAYTERDARPLERIGSLVLGARKRPQLRELLPTRPPGTPDCLECGGTGDWRVGKGILCPTCEGLGWVPPAI